jgi:hypothetical protein
MPFCQVLIGVYHVRGLMALHISGPELAESYQRAALNAFGEMNSDLENLFSC